MSKRFSLETKLIFAATVVLLMFLTAAVGASVFGGQEHKRETAFIVSSETLYKGNYRNVHF